MIRDMGKKVQKFDTSMEEIMEKLQLSAAKMDEAEKDFKDKDEDPWVSIPQLQTLLSTKLRRSHPCLPQFGYISTIAQIILNHIYLIFYFKHIIIWYFDIH